MHELGKVPGAIGPNALHVFRIGEGEFERGPLADRLLLVPDKDDHGTVQPAATMPYESYRQAIVDTRDLWVSGESDD
jgi:hypothetical protein